jgi:hypothetical protein
MAAMATVIDGAFARILKLDRTAFNARVAAARSASPGLDTDEFSEVLITVVAPIVDAIAAATNPRDPVPGDPDPTAIAIANELFGIALELCAQHRMSDAIRVGWATLLPDIGTTSAEHPRRLIAAVTNAIHHLDQTVGTNPTDWIRKMQAVTRFRPSVDEFLTAGQVTAWVAGLAAARPQALNLAAQLRPELLLAIFGFDASALEAMRTDPWLYPHGMARRTDPVHIGSFRGLGGQFINPPRLRTDGENLLATDGEGWWMVVADVFGSAALRTEPPQSPWPPQGPAPEAINAMVEPTSWARTPGGYAATSALSFGVTFFPDTHQRSGL